MTRRELPKTYDPAEIEPKWYRFWSAQGYFHADAALPKTPYTIVVPPPNVTGSLHMGHALTFSIQDILIRWKRMEGYNALWQPGTDHAGIATQMVVERELHATEQRSRHDLGREVFLERVWKWKEESGGRISEQLRVLGCSLDWQRERFTMDPAYALAVREAFVRLYDEGLIYRARRLINWCPRCYTALSDLEVNHKDQEGSLYHIAYPVNGSDVKLVVATTRPETMLGDTAVAVHPEDERWRGLIGRTVRLPLAGRDIPIVGDPVLVDREFGSGAVKVTPGHDFNDFESGLRNRLEQLSILDLHGKVVAPAPARYRGLGVAEARAQVVRDLEAEGHLVRVEPHQHSVGGCQRCDTVVEPMLSMQWFVKTAPLARPAIEAVEQGKVKFVPASWAKTYFHWMTNIKDWCISRQLWWGHRIPAFYCDGCGDVLVTRRDEDAAACPKCRAPLRQDEDVLDTWFSSALWPFATLGWPEATRELKTFYPTSVMETGYDIIFFWVARMMMMGLHFMKKVPFRTVFLHAMVVDEKGEKMSKVRGNVIDPLDLTSKFGADALRFTIAALAAQGRNIKLSLQRVEGYRHFANKVWNASRFALMNLDGFDPDRFSDAQREGPTALALELPDQWILSRLQGVSREVDRALTDFKVNEAAQAIYRFVWTELCDWYIELSKGALRAEGEAGDARRRVVQGVLTTALETAMRLLHPFMPFLTEEIWQQLPKPAGTPGSIMITLFPVVDERYDDAEAERAMGLLQGVISAVRTLRAEYNVPPGAQRAT
jgi:valyl-tRNA synthetase